MERKEGKEEKVSTQTNSGKNKMLSGLSLLMEKKREWILNVPVSDAPLCSPMCYIAGVGHRKGRMQ